MNGRAFSEAAPPPASLTLEPEQVLNMKNVML